MESQETGGNNPYGLPEGQEDFDSFSEIKDAEGNIDFGDIDNDIAEQRDEEDLNFDPSDLNVNQPDPWITATFDVETTNYDDQEQSSDEEEEEENIAQPSGEFPTEEVSQFVFSEFNVPPNIYPNSTAYGGAFGQPLPPQRPFLQEYVSANQNNPLYQVNDINYFVKLNDDVGKDNSTYIFMSHLMSSFVSSLGIQPYISFLIVRILYNKMMLNCIYPEQIENMLKELIYP